MNADPGTVAQREAVEQKLSATERRLGEIEDELNAIGDRLRLAFRELGKARRELARWQPDEHSELVLDYSAGDVRRDQRGDGA
jgi:hypothetical protein